MIIFFLVETNKLPRVHDVKQCFSSHYCS